MKDTDTEEDTGTTAQAGVKKSYQKPELIRFGALRDLTTGGSSTANEENCVPDDPGGCNPDKNKRRPG